MRDRSARHYHTIGKATDPGRQQGRLLQMPMPRRKRPNYAVGGRISIRHSTLIQWRTLSSMQTVVELPEFIRRAQQLLSEGESQLLVSYLAEFPQAGVLIEGTGGIRKIRWAREAMGKRGGVRVISLSQRPHAAVLVDGVRQKRES